MPISLEQARAYYDEHKKVCSACRNNRLCLVGHAYRKLILEKEEGIRAS